MKPYKHQEELSDIVLAALRVRGIHYLASEERTGKTLTAILVAEKSAAVDILVVTKKKAKKGWDETLAAYPVTCSYTVTTYTQAHNLTPRRYDLVILDEAHTYISSSPKPSQAWKLLRPICQGTPILYLSATPHPQGYHQLFHQFKLCSYGPWNRYTTFYKWFKDYGIPYTMEINGIEVPQYTRTKAEKVLKDIEGLFTTKTRQELGFEHEPEDVIHWIEPSDALKAVYNILVKKQIVKLSVGTLVCDNKSKERTSLHQLEGGTIKIEDNYFTLPNTEKIDYIKEHFGDRSSLVIMYNFKQELKKLQEHFKEAQLLQATSYAEGVDLSMYDDLVIYSQDYSTGRHTQRRARQANMERKTPIKVHFLLMKNAVSQQVYKTVSVNKKNFVDSVFTRNTI